MYKKDRSVFINPKNDLGLKEKDRNHLKIVTYGDQDMTGKDTRDAIIGLSRMDLLVLLGDYSYDIQDQYGLNGDDYFEWMEPVLTRAPVILTPGNHENFANTEFFLYRFMMAGTRNPLENNFFAVQSHLAKLMQLNFDYLMKNPDLTDIFLSKVEKTLETWDSGNKKCFTYFFSHRPFHCDLNNHECVELRNQFAQFEEKLVNYPINVFLWGHVHHYERLRSVYKEEETNRSNQFYLIVGTGGNKEDEENAKEAKENVISDDDSKNVKSIGMAIKKWKSLILQVIRKL